MNNSQKYSIFTDLIKTVIDNRGKSVPTTEKGFPLIATNCIKLSSIYPTFENVRYISDETLRTWFRAHINPKDILLVNKGTPGRTCLVPDPVSFCVAQDMVAVRVEENKISYKYLFAVLRSDYVQKQISNFHVGLVIPHFKKGDFNKLMIPRQSTKDKENAIGDLYLSISEKIELNNKINAELEAMAKMLYDYWFVQFDFPDQKGKPYKSSGGKMVWNEDLKREIPGEWKMNNLKDITSVLVRGISPKYCEDDGICVLNQKCIRDKSINFTLGKRHDNVFKKSESKLIEVGDILVNSTGVGTLGRLAMVKRLEERQTTVDSHLTIVRIDQNKANRLFAGYALTEKQTEIEQLGEGSTGQIELSRDSLGKLKLVIPPAHLQKTFESILNPIIQKISNNELQNTQLLGLRDWLLPMFMNGQITVSGI